MTDKKTLLGGVGEKIVANYMSKQGIIVEQSVDPYDSQKDMKINGKPLEVKTQVPFVYMKCFTLKKNQLNKCLNAEYFVFVQAPCKHWDEAAIYQVENGFKYGIDTMKNGDERYTIPINQPAVNKVMQIEGNDKEILRRYATPF